MNARGAKRRRKPSWVSAPTPADPPVNGVIGPIVTGAEADIAAVRSRDMRAQANMMWHAGPVFLVFVVAGLLVSFR